MRWSWPSDVSASDVRGAQPHWKRVCVCLVAISALTAHIGRSEGAASKKNNRERHPGNGTQVIEHGHREERREGARVVGWRRLRSPGDQPQVTHPSHCPWLDGRARRIIIHNFRRFITRSMPMELLYYFRGVW